MTNTDKIIFFIAVYLFWRGWSKGLLQTVLGPISLVAATIVSYVYYMATHNMVVTIAIGTIGPIILSIILSMTFGTILLGSDKKNISILSRLCGACINTVWGEFLIVTGIFLVLFIPLKIPVLESMQNDISRSWTYDQVKTNIDQFFDKDVAGALDPAKLTALTDPKGLQTLGKTKEFEEIMNHPLVQDLLNDPQAKQAIEQKDISKLIQSPKFIAVTKDPELLKKFLSLYAVILKPAQPQKETKTVP